MAIDASLIAAKFDIRGPVIEAVPYGNGHINDTFRVRVSQGGVPIDYILQRINHNVFPNVKALMNNILRVTNHLKKKIMELEPNADFSRRVLTLIPTLEGANYTRGPEGFYWRMYIFIPDALSYDYVSDPSQAYEAAFTFGKFQSLLSDLPGSPLFDTIPDFHNTPKRFQTFLSSLKSDPLNRAKDVKAEIDFALSFQDQISKVTDGIAAGRIPNRVTHNDTKINNILLDKDTGKGICVLDLDTVMPGSVLYDFGDEIRSTTATAAEDERDLSKVKFRMDMFEGLVHGYLDATRTMLTHSEYKLLAFSGSLMTFEVGLRFLTDHIDGDKYFKIHRENHNLDRCRTQFELVRQMVAAQDEMQKIVETY